MRRFVRPGRGFCRGWRVTAWIGAGSGQGNVQDGHLDLDGVTSIEVLGAVAARVELRAGDILMTEGGDLDKLGRGYFPNGRIPGCLHQNHIFAVRCFQIETLIAYRKSPIHECVTGQRRVTEADL